MRKHNHTSCILPKNGADKKVFLSAMIKSFLRRMAKMRRYKHESGRSMVEMLGVLAIIGVLSVGGIAGYSKAMRKQRINNTLDKISNIVARVAELQVSNIHFGRNANLAVDTMAEQYGFDCPSLITGYGHAGDGYCSLPIGGYRIYLSENSNKEVYNNYAELLITLNGIVDYDMCIAFVNYKIYEYVPEEWYTNYGGYIWIQGRDSEGRTTTRKLREANRISEFEYGPTEEISITDAADLCTPCESSYPCSIQWHMF